ncbi:MAG: hypothetical protein K8H88_32925 [Sandaracinaceae bacterium]|nr:hypothetical protein [Sandaracinaceae bacterium]
MRTATLLVLVLSLPLATSGCFVVSDAHLQSLRQDGGTQVDGGPPAPQLDDRCGAASPRLVLGTTLLGLQIDTTTLTNQVTSSCGISPSAGNDAFLAIESTAGQYWHFHVQADPAFPDSATRRPILYLLSGAGGSCDARDCTFVADQCDENGEEHFGFEAPSTGRFFLGIDDAAAGGGHYLLHVIQPSCGDGNPEHGQYCDDGNDVLGDGCTPTCLHELSMDAPNEREPNDNFREANFLIMPAANELDVSGDVGGAGACLYPDTFAINVQAGARVEVDVIESDGTVCDVPSLSAAYDLALLNSDGDVVVSGMTNATTGCKEIRTAALSRQGQYYVSVRPEMESDRSQQYTLRIRIAP